MKSRHPIAQHYQRQHQEASAIAVYAWGQFDPLRLVVGEPRTQARVRLGVLKLQPTPRLP